MVRKATLIWIVGLLTLVPYGTWYLFFEAPREQYALLITLVLFWIFGYWGVAGPILAALRIRSVMRAIESARSRDDLLRTFSSPEAKEAAIDLIASENRLPRFLARRVYDLLAARLRDAV